MERECVEGRRRGGKESQVCTCCSLRHSLRPSSAHRRVMGVVDRNSCTVLGVRRPATEVGVTTQQVGVCTSLPFISFLGPSSLLFAKHSLITIRRLLSLHIEFKSLPLTESTLSGGSDLRTPSTVFLFEEFRPLEYCRQLSARVQHRGMLSFFLPFFWESPGKVKQ